jgi:hypothetical protein
MKKFIFLIISFFICFAAIANNNITVEVFYFHADERCESDLQIEAECRNIIETVFSNEIKEGKIVFKAINFMNPENKAIAEKFEIGWSTLLINKIKNGEEELINLNDFAFTNIPANPINFRKGFENQIKQLLN